MPEKFVSKILEFIKTIPKGKTMSYGQVAAACGRPRAARQVGTVLKLVDWQEKNIPWWRVVNSTGQISIKGNWTASKELQKKLLEQEGVKISDNFKIIK